MRPFSTVATGITMSMNKDTALTVDLAKTFLADESSVDLRVFATVDAAAAELLAASPCGRLDLRGLHALNGGPEATRLAEKLAEQFSDQYLDFPHLVDLSPDAAVVFAKHRYPISLGLTQISESLAGALIKTKKSKHQDSALILPNLTSIDDATASILAKHKAPLRLDGLRDLTAGAAKALAKHTPYLLSLNGINALSDDCMKFLATHAGPLSLNGIPSLSEQNAKALADCPGLVIVLNGVRGLSAKVAKTLSVFKGTVGEGDMPYGGKTYTLPAGYAASSCLCLDGIEFLEPEVVTALAKLKGVLSLKGVVAHIKSLSNSADDIALAKLLAGKTWTADELVFSSLEHIDLEAAGEIASFKGRLTATALKDVDPANLKPLRLRPTLMTTVKNHRSVDGQ